MNKATGLQHLGFLCAVSLLQ